MILIDSTVLGLRQETDIDQRTLVGQECDGIETKKLLIVVDASVRRDHFHIVLYANAEVTGFVEARFIRQEHPIG